jgi:hypothetical protein
MSCDDDATGYKATAVLFKTCIDRATCFQSRTAICRVGVPAQTVFYGGWTHKKHMASTTDAMHTQTTSTTAGSRRHSRE